MNTQDSILDKYDYKTKILIISNQNIEGVLDLKKKIL